jgi:signal transduction histidine kinase
LTITVVFLYLKRKQLIEQYRNETRLKAIQHKQRLDISHELHDNVGAQLTYLSSHLKLLSEQDPHNNKILSLLEASNEAILSLRETVWALNNEHITLTDFSDKFKSFAYKIHPINPNIRYKVKETFEHEYTLQPIQALNLFRLCQEAFCNALKHSKAKNIYILFSNSEECAFCIEIKDDGIGFDINGIKENGHFGLENMNSRAKEIGVIFDLKSQKDIGTSIFIKLKNL